MKRILLAVVFLLGVVVILFQGVALGKLALHWEAQGDLAISFWYRSGSVACYVMAVFTALLGPAVILHEEL